MNTIQAFTFKFGDTSALSDAENSRNILLTYSSHNINDNLSSLTGPFKAGNANNKILKNVPSQHCSSEEFETHISIRTQTQCATGV